MSLRRKVVIAGALIFLAFIVVHAVLPWSSSIALAIPPGVAPQRAVYHCGALWGSGFVHGTVRQYLPASTPCAHRATYQVTTVLSTLLALAVLAGALLWGRTAPSRAAG